MIETPTGKRIVVIGGGISGLAAAHRLYELSGQRGENVHVTLLEARPRIGGSIETQHRDGFLLEGGPDAFITQKPWAMALCRRLGIADDVIPTNEKYRRAFIVRKGRMHPIPEGFMMLAPTKMWPFAFTGLFSWPGKVRMAMDVLLPRGPQDGDQSLADFVRRRLGREALERAAQPLVGSIYASNPETLSLRATMPRFLEIEKKYRSVILGMRAAQKAMGKRSAGDSGARYSIFVTMREGLAQLVDAVAAALPPGTVHVGCRVKRLAPAPDGPGWQIAYESQGGSAGESRGQRILADGVVLAAPAYSLIEMLEGVDSDLLSELRMIEYASTLTVNFAFERASVAHPLDAFGVVVPHVEGTALIGATFTNVKFPGRAPEGKTLVRAFVGGALNPWAYEMEDDAVVARVRNELDTLIGIKGRPLFATVHRWPKAMAQFPVGHLDRVARVDRLLEFCPPAAIAGNAFAGGGVPDCVRRGEEAAERVLTALAGVEKKATFQGAR